MGKRKQGQKIAGRGPRGTAFGAQAYQAGGGKGEEKGDRGSVQRRGERRSGRKLTRQGGERKSKKRGSRTGFSGVQGVPRSWRKIARQKEVERGWEERGWGERVRREGEGGRARREGEKRG